MSYHKKLAVGLGAAGALAGVAAATRIPFEIALVVKPEERDQHLRVPSGEAYADFRDFTIRGVTELQEKEFSWVYVEAEDGAMLRGRYYRGEEGKPLDICFHGYRGTALRDFCGGGPMLLSLGHSMLLVDERGQGGSEGPCMTMGIRERRDVLTWVDYARTVLEWQSPIFLYGVSMGAAAVVMASSLELPAQVKGIVADSPYSSVPEIMKLTMKKLHYPEALYRLVRLSAKLYGHVNLEEISGAEAAAQAKVPILVIHGEADTMVPVEMSEPIAAANPDRVTRETFPGAEHVMSFVTDRDRYLRLVLDFMDRCLT